ncbi:MAG: replicative DNA helicase [Actinopolymorphaceae bacterium]
MLLSKDAIADVIEAVRGTDFYKPAHETVYEAVLDLYGRGEPADAVTISAELQRSGELGRIGGAPYLHTLIASVPSAANAGYYAAIVREKAILRRLVEAGTKVTQLGYAGDGDVDDVVDRAQAEVYGVTDKRGSEDYRPLSEIMEATLDEIEAIGSRGGQMIGVPTGFADMDSLTNGLHPGQLVVIAARPGVGKALALDTPLPTPFGWTAMGQVAVGDQLMGANGAPTTVVAVTDVMVGRPCYEVEFSDGTVIVADAQHLWRTTTRASRRQAAETKRTWYWSSSSLARVRSALAVAEAATDDQISPREAVGLVGAEFPHVLHTVGKGVGRKAKTLRPAVGSSGRYLRPTLVYSRQELLGSLYERIVLPKNAATTVVHGHVLTTENVAASLRCADGRVNHAVENAAPLATPERQLPLPPYMVGAWLGDGSSYNSQFTTADPEIVIHLETEGLRVSRNGPRLYTIRLPESAATADRACIICGELFRPKSIQTLTCSWECSARSRKMTSRKPVTCPDCGGPLWGMIRCRSCNAHHGSVKAILRRLGLLRNKHIPVEYLRASEAQRRALLAGLLDTDGTVTAGGAVQFSVVNERLALDTYELIVSLGYRCAMTSKRVKGRSESTSTAYILTFSSYEDVFRLERKRIVHQTRRATNNSRSGSRYIIAVRQVPSVPVRCVQVDSDDHMFLASRAMIPTHNSILALNLARSASIQNDLASVIFSLEMSRTEITMRLLSAEARVPLQHMRQGSMSDDDWARLARKMGEVSGAPLFIDDSPNMTLMEIRAKCRRLRQRHDLKLVIIDYLQLMTSGKRVESRQVEVSEFSRNLKLLAKELEVPVVAVAQLNRGPEQRTDKRPMLSDLRESGSIEQDADMVILLHREDAYERESSRPGEADFIVAKHRNGPTANLTVAFQGHYQRFVDMAQG